jgi:hypothetical protein
MRIGRVMALSIVIGLVLAGCGRSDSVQSVGYRGYTSGNGVLPTGGTVSPPSSGTSNGTGTAVPAATE